MSAISPNPLSGTDLSSPSPQHHWPLRNLHPNELLIDLGDVSRRSSVADLLGRLRGGISRRWHRERRRRKVGRAYDMALEIARSIPIGSRVLDVGCGNGFIAHHLSAILHSTVTGIDLAETAEAPINYHQFDGSVFPVKNQTFDAILFCYVLHHAQELATTLKEAQRVLSEGGVLVVYEDIPQRRWDRIVCSIHDRKWRGRTGPCTFRGELEWQETFASEGFEMTQMRRLSRWRNLAHPVSRRLYVLRLTALACGSACLSTNDPRNSH